MMINDPRLQDKREDSREFLRYSTLAAALLTAGVATAFPEPKITMPKDITHLIELVKKDATSVYSDGKIKSFHKYFVKDNKMYVAEYMDKGKEKSDDIINHYDSLRVFYVPLAEKVKLSVDKDHEKSIKLSELEKAVNFGNLNEAMPKTCYDANNINEAATPCYIASGPGFTQKGTAKDNKGYHKMVTDMSSILESGNYVKVKMNKTF